MNIPITFFLFLAVAEMSFAGPAGIVAIGQLLRSADIVVVGTVTGVADSGTEVDISLVVNRTVKGAATAGSAIGVQWLPILSPEFRGSRYSVGRTGIWFLKRTESALIVLPVTGGAVPLADVYIGVSPDPLPSQGASDANLSSAFKLANELRAAAQNPVIEPATRRILSSGAADDLDDNALQPTWENLSSSADAGSKALGWAGEIRRGQTAPLTALAGAGPGAISPDALNSLTMAICQFSGNDPGAIASLGSLAKSTFPDSLKGCAVHALRRIHTRETIAFLAAELDSPSQQMQYEAVAGIASFANGLPVQTAQNTANMSAFAIPPNSPLSTADTRKNFPSRSAFSQQPQMYISFWKGWVTAHPVE